MCYFLYGAVNNGINDDDYKKATKDAEYHFNCGDINSVNNCVENCGTGYRITLNHCDCDTAIGQKNTNKNQLKNLEELLLYIKKVRGIKHILISKNWWKETNNKQETVHIDDIDILSFLANMEDNCLYKIELYKKYY
ncbi:MAG: hypothetical protein E7480_04185 [Ruminococcaceae bacterium]|nr:hypothetical protein [Oscillospiraceae bacterium]